MLDCVQLATGSAGVLVRVRLLSSARTFLGEMRY